MAGRWSAGAEGRLREAGCKRLSFQETRPLGTRALLTGCSHSRGRAATPASQPLPLWPSPPNPMLVWPGGHHGLLSYLEAAKWGRQT